MVGHGFEIHIAERAGNYYLGPLKISNLRTKFDILFGPRCDIHCSILTKQLSRCPFINRTIQHTQNPNEHSIHSHLTENMESSCETNYLKRSPLKDISNNRDEKTVELDEGLPLAENGDIKEKPHIKMFIQFSRAVNMI